MAERRADDLRDGGSALWARREGVVAADILDLGSPRPGVVDFLDGDDIAESWLELASGVIQTSFSESPRSPELWRVFVMSL